MTRIYGPNQLATQAVRAAERYEYHRPSHVIFPQSLLLGPATVLIVPLVFGKDGVLIEGGLHPSVEAVEHITEYAVPTATAAPNTVGGWELRGVEVSMAALLVVVIVGRRLWMRLERLDPTTGTWRSV